MGAEGSFTATNTSWIREGLIETNGRGRPNPRFANGTDVPSDFSVLRLWTDAKIAYSNSTVHPSQSCYGKRTKRLVSLFTMLRWLCQLSHSLWLWVARLTQEKLMELFHPRSADRTWVMAATC